MSATDSRRRGLHAILEGLPAVAVAVSGGVDSLTLATLAHRHRPGRVTAFHAVSPAVPEAATARVRSLARTEGWPLEVVDAGEFADRRYRDNPVNRCYYCKSHLYDAIAARTAVQVVSGTNVDDLGEYRPGLDAAAAHSVRHPYVEAGIDKAMLRELARELGLDDIARLPASPCLSSRVETGIVIEPDMLALIDDIEIAVAQLTGCTTVRCRVRAAGLVIELDQATLSALDPATEHDLRGQAARFMRAVGHDFALSFAPYRNGSAFLHTPVAGGDSP